MGVWGTGLYSGDFAMDLRATIGAVLRLPFDSEELLKTIKSLEREAADSPEDPDHASFWLVVADQFAKYGIDSREARERALDIIDRGSDLAVNRSLGMDDKSLRKRGSILLELRERLSAPFAERSRRTLKRPQQLRYEVGDVFVYPTATARITGSAVPRGHCLPWNQDGWGAVVIVERGLYLDFLAWYRPLIPFPGWADKPTLDEILAPRRWFCRLAGTLTPKSEARLELSKIGQIPIDEERMKRALPYRFSPKFQVLSDISIGNQMSIYDRAERDAHLVQRGRLPTSRIESVRDIMA